MLNVKLFCKMSFGTKECPFVDADFKLQLSYTSQARLSKITYFITWPPPPRSASHFFSFFL